MGKVVEALVFRRCIIFWLGMFLQTTNPILELEAMAMSNVVTRMPMRVAF